MHNHNEDHHHEHAHTHEQDHGHGHTHEQDAEHTHSHHHGGHEDLLGSKAEAAAFLKYTLEHNAHHNEELASLAHSLQHLGLNKSAQEVRGCMDDIERTNSRLASVMAQLKD